jgi:DNA-binding MarR family transcriptional regulator
MQQKSEKCEFTSLEPNPIMDIIQSIRKIGRKFDRLQGHLVQSTNLTPPQYFIMEILWKNDNIAFKDIAAACCCTRSTITGIIDTLEEKGLVTRTPNTQDRRSQLVQLTETGKNLQNQVPPVEKFFGTCCGGMDPSEIIQLRDLLLKLFNLLPG